jgi:hypothetical protein
MSWEKKLKQAAYISPLGFRTTFLYEDVSKSFDKKTTDFNFPASNNTYIQDFGRTGRKFPLRIFFSGDNYLQEALAFEASIETKGVGRLEHPIYGTINVVPFGEYNRRDNLKTEANQAVIEVIFWETIIEIFAGSITDLADIVLKALELYNEAASGQLNTEIILNKIIESSGFKTFYAGLVRGTLDSLNNIVATTPSVEKQFNLVSQSMLTDLESTQSPNVKVLGLQATTLVQLPSRATGASISDRLNAFDNAFQKLVNDKTIQPPGYDNRIANEFFARDFYSATYLSGVVLSTINAEFTTKKEALTAADFLLSLFDQWVKWRDENYAILSQNDTGGMYAALLESVTKAVGYIVSISFSLKTEKIIILTENRSILDLVAELYGELDNKLDFFINTNNLSGSEILELPKGREIVYYV